MPVGVEVDAPEPAEVELELGVLDALAGESDDGLVVCWELLAIEGLVPPAWPPQLAAVMVIANRRQLAKVNRKRRCITTSEVRY